MMPGAKLAGSAVLLILLSLGVAGREPTLVEAGRARNTQAALTLLAQGVDVNAPEADGTTALHWAAHHDDLPLAEALLRAGARADTANRYGVTPIYLAAENGSAVMIERLLLAGADPNTALPEGETTLMTAARAGNADAVSLLLAHGADPNAREGWRGQTALMWAAAENNAGVIRVLAGAGAEIDATSRTGSLTPLLFAVRHGHIDATRALLDAGADVNERLPDGMSALVLAVFNAHYELAAFLLEKGADPNANAQGWTALHQVTWSRRPNRGFNLPGAVPTGDLDSLELVQKLVAHGADVNARMTREPRDGNRNMLNRIGSTPFLMAAKSADVPLMRRLLDLGADPSLTNEDGSSAVMVAAGVGVFGPGESPGTHEEALAAVKLALEVGGGTVNDIDKNGETAVHGAVYRGGAASVIALLAERGARLDVENAKGWTPLIAADGVVYGSSGIRRYPEAAVLLRELLRERGADVRELEHVPNGIVPVREARAPETRHTNWDGVFSDAQAERGRQVYQRECAFCHREDLLGDTTAPELVGETFTKRWLGTTAHDMVELIRETMPQNAPDSLGDQAYVDLISYLLKVNGSPTGAADLAITASELRQVLITERPRVR
jgi:uncharacterized protein